MMVLITLPLVIAFPKLTSNIFFNAETQKNYELAQLVLNSFGQTYIESILRTETLENQERVVEGQIAHFDRQVKKKLRSSSVAKVKLFGATGTTVYSSHLVEIGGDDQESEGFQSAIQGEAHSTGIKQKQFHGISGTLENRYIFSTYVPVKTSETGKVIGVFELYSDVTPTYMLIRRADRALGISVLVLAVLIYLFLQLIVRRGEGVIARQYKELSTIQEQLSQQADELKRSNQELETFAYIASHDLQEPLRKIQAFGDRLSKKFIDELGDYGLMY